MRLISWGTAELFLTEASAAVHVQTWAWVALAVVGAPGVDTSVLAASVMDLALVDICSRGGSGGRRKGQKQVVGHRRQIN